MPYAVHRKSERTNKSRLSRVFATRAFAVRRSPVPRGDAPWYVTTRSDFPQRLSRSFNQFRTPLGRISIFTYRG
jgi:hypothetical protein